MVYLKLPRTDVGPVTQNVTVTLSDCHTHLAWPNLKSFGLQAPRALKSDQVYPHEQLNARFTVSFRRAREHGIQSRKSSGVAGSFDRWVSRFPSRLTRRGRPAGAESIPRISRNSAFNLCILIGAAGAGATDSSICA